jgi:transcriptional regulator with XRE-family HTH domain
MSEETLGQRVRRLRLARGLSQEELAHQVGVSKTQVYLVENGTTRSPRRRYCEAMRVSLASPCRTSPPVLMAQRLPIPRPGLHLRCTFVTPWTLSDEEIAQIVRIVRALEMEQQGTGPARAWSCAVVSPFSRRQAAVTRSASAALYAYMDALSVTRNLRCGGAEDSHPLVVSSLCPSSAKRQHDGNWIRPATRAAPAPRPLTARARRSDRADGAAEHPTRFRSDLPPKVGGILYRGPLWMSSW